MKQKKTILNIAAIILAAALLAFLFLPAIHYTYNGVVYDLNGITMLTGGTVCGGTVRIVPSVFVILFVVLAVLAVCFGGIGIAVKKERVSLISDIGGIVLSTLAAAAVILYSMTAESALSAAGAKQVGIGQIAYLVALAIAALKISLHFYSLFESGVIDSLWDGAASALLLILSMAVPFGTYTYKKTTHPFTGFDLMLGKEVAKETVTDKSIYPMLLLAVAAVILAILFVKKLSKKVRALVAGAGSLIAAVLLIVMTVSSRNIITDIKDGAIGVGLLVPMLLVILIFVRALIVLWQEKTISALDFMLLPGLAYLLINNYLPMIGISFAFKKMDYTVGVWNSPWVGLDNFKYLFSTNTAWIITRNTILYNLAFIVVSIFMGIVAGICLAAITKKVVRTIYQTSILLPQLISMIIVAYIVYAFLSSEAGFINKSILGTGNEVNFYGDTKIWPFLLVFIYNWKQIGYNAVIFLSSIVGIDKGLYEAAMVDGCSPWQQITKITLPQLKPTIITLTLLQVGRVFYSDFGLFYQVPMDSGALYNVTNTIDTYVYRSMMVLNNISSASAANAFQSICGFILVFTVNMIVRKVDNENALF